MRKLIEAMKPTVVRVSSGEESGSGFLVGDGCALTCLHVVKGASKVTLWNTKIGSITATVAEIDENHDLALLRMATGATPHLQFGNYGELAEGDGVLFMGYPVGVNMCVAHRGMISFKGRIEFKYLSAPVDSFALDGSVNRGNSGGPVVSVRKGTVVGIVNAKLGDLSEKLYEFRRRREILKKLGVSTSVQFGVVEVDGRQVVGSDQGDVLAEIVDFLSLYTNAGVGYALSADYARELVSHKVA